MPVMVSWAPAAVGQWAAALSSAGLAVATASAAVLVHKTLFGWDDKEKLCVAVFGVSRGLGMHIARELVERGHIVVGFSRTETTIENLFDERVSIAGGSQNGSANRQRFCWRRCDMGSDDSVRMAMIAAMEYLKRNRFPMFDLILLNAGASCSRKRPVWEDGVLSEANEIINTNVMGSFRVVREAMRHLSNTQGDRPVWILLTEGQGSGGRGTPGNAAYGLSKAATRQFANSLAAEFSEREEINPDSRKFRCGLISPGMVATRLLSNASRNIDPESPRMKTLANLAEDPKKVARWYARKIENIPKMRPPGARSVKRFSFLTVFGVVSRLIAAPFGLRRRHIARMKALIHPSRGGGEQQGRQQSQNWRRN